MSTTSNCGVDVTVGHRYGSRMTSAKWYENHANVLQLLREMNEDNDEMTVATCLEVLAKPWNWSDEFARLCGLFLKDEVPTALYEGMLLFREGDEDRPDVVYAVTDVGDEYCECRIVDIRRRYRYDTRPVHAGDETTVATKALLGGGYLLEEEFQLEFK